MKKHLMLISALLCSVLGFSQGIEFEHGSWSEVLAKAKQANKPIFVEVSATWCGACQMMKRNILTLKEVGQEYNANFICYEVDAEKGDGVTIRKNYDVRPIPAYLFIRPDGSLFYRVVGAMDAKGFIGESRKALAAMNDTKPINLWDNELADHKNDPQFLLGYITKRNALGITNAGLFDEYLKLLPDSGRVCATTIKVYQMEQDNLTIQSFAYTYLMQNREKFKRISVPEKFFMDYTLDLGIRNTLRLASAKKDEKLLEEAVAAYERLPKDIESFCEIGFYTPYYCKEEIYMEYYQRTEEKTKYLEHVVRMGNDYLLKMTDEAISEKDMANAQKLDEAIRLGKFEGTTLDAGKLSGMKMASKSALKNAIGWRLNYNANEILNNVSDKQILNQAIQWSKRSLELFPKNPGWKNTYAKLLYKSGRNAEAIAKQQEMLSQIDKAKNPKAYQEKLRLIQRMKAGEKI